MGTVEIRTVVADRYALEAQLASDPAAVTWLATDIVLDRRVRLTLARPEVADDRGVLAAIDAATRALARIPAGVVLALLDAGVQDGLTFVVTEHVEGPSLEDILAERGRIDPDEVLEIGTQVLRGLTELHPAGTLHLDLRPATIVRTADGIRIVAPGSMQAVIRAHRAAGLGGDGRVLPPEGLSGAVDERSDVWCAGALLFELLTGHAPAPTARFARAERRDVGRALDAAIARALAPDPLDRYADAPAMLDALEGIDRRPAPHADAGEPAPGRRGVFRTWLAVPMIVAVVAFIVVAAGLRLGRLELGGPIGIRVPQASPSAIPAGPSVVEVEAVSAHDPFGDGEENSDDAPYAADGDRGTVWRSENYFDGELYKDGVGLLFDLGRTVDVGSIRMWTPSPGFSFSIRVGDDARALVDADAAETRASGETRVQVDGRGRYLLLWITSVVPTADGNRVEIADVRVLEAGS